jgi:hypothetical protein
MQKAISQFSFFIFILMCPVVVYALTPQQVIDLKKAGVSDQTIQMMIEQEEKAKDPYATMGTKEIKDKDGNTVIIYTTGKSTDSDDDEEKKVEKAWEMLRNITIKQKR